MTEYFTEEQAIAAVPGLSQVRLLAFMGADLVTTSHRSADGTVFRPVDLARLELLCDLADQFDLDGDALGVVIGLIDQLHHTRLRLLAMAQAIEAEPVEFRHRVGARFVGLLAV